MIQFFASETGIVFTFNVSIGGTIPDLLGATVKLLVLRNSRSPFLCVNSGTQGETQYVVLAGDFPIGQYRAYLVFEKISTGVRLFSNPFDITSLPDPS